MCGGDSGRFVGFLPFRPREGRHRPMPQQAHVTNYEARIKMHITDRGPGVRIAGRLATVGARRWAGARWKNCSDRTSEQEFPRQAAENANSRRSRGGTGRRCRLRSGVEGGRHHTEAAFTFHRKRHRAPLPGDRPSPNCRRETDRSTLRSFPDWCRHDGLHGRSRCRGDAYGVRPRLLPWRMGRPRCPSCHHTHHVPVLRRPDGVAVKPLRACGRRDCCGMLRCAES